MFDRNVEILMENPFRAMLAKLDRWLEPERPIDLTLGWNQREGEWQDGPKPPEPVLPFPKASEAIYPTPLRRPVQVEG